MFWILFWVEWWNLYFFFSSFFFLLNYQKNVFKVCIVLCILCFITWHVGCKCCFKKDKNVLDPTLGMNMSNFHNSVNNTQIRMILLMKIVLKLLLIHLPSNYVSFSTKDKWNIHKWIRFLVPAKNVRISPKCPVS